MLAGLAALALAMAASPARGDDTAAMFGVSVNRVFNDDFTPSHWNAPLTAVREAGIREARSDAFWMWAEPAAPQNGVHVYDWGKLDEEAAALATHGLHWRPILDYSALWAASNPDYHSPPASNDDYAAYAGAFAERYGRGGTFWTDHPELDPLPVTNYEIWNEPNGAWFWKPAPDAARYADMYLKARAAIRAIDPAATVVVGGLVAHTAYVEAMYAARPELRGNVDAVGWHPYAPSASGVIGDVRALRHTLERLGDPGVPIHLTELGWPTSGQHSAIVLGEDARAAALESATDSLARSDCGVASVIAYTWSTPEQNPDDVEDWYGIRHPDGRATPSSDAYARVVARWESEPVTEASRPRLCHPPDTDADAARPMPSTPSRSTPPRAWTPIAIVWATAATGARWTAAGTDSRG
jgi:polysaccharide biosynthesis protein PslG